MTSKLLNKKPKKVSCGFIIEDPNCKILFCHPTGSGKRYDFPKGIRDDTDASDLDAAIRELKEETGLSDLDLDMSSMVDLGQRSYSKEKDLHLFLVKAREPLSNYFLSCESMFITESGRKLPEIDGYVISTLSNEQEFLTDGMKKYLASAIGIDHL
jgi:8-oxo-dGTP pyrophosphatase MutT (NUDIX family)